jgi:N-acyl-D-aspartate/D-glutamate deacylase
MTKPRASYLIRNALLVDGSGAPGAAGDLAIVGDRIAGMGMTLDWDTDCLIDGTGLVLAPGFIDTHTHDDLTVLVDPQCLPKLSQGVTTVIVGNCGVSASPTGPGNVLPDPMNLLGARGEFCYETFVEYVAAIAAAEPAVNVAALVGHTTLRANHMDRLDRAATVRETEAMRSELGASLAAGALGLSTGLAYLSAIAADTDEVLRVAEPLAAFGGIYATHLRSETDAILAALDEACSIGKRGRIPIVISHFKCAGIDNWGRAAEVLEHLEPVRGEQQIGFDCYPYTAGSSTLDLRQVDPRVRITITWSEPHPVQAGRDLSAIAEQWGVSQHEAASRLLPAGAIYHSIAEQDMQRFLAHPATMIGSDGLPRDPLPHPRLWGTFARVLGRYSREEKLFSLEEAVRKMTSLPAARFRLADRGCLSIGAFADLVLFDAGTITDTSSYDRPTAAAEGIYRVWVNGVASYQPEQTGRTRAGRFLARQGAAQEPRGLPW